MDEFTKKIFDRITSKDVSALTKSDIVFLRARSSYLTEEQLSVYSPLFNKDPEEKVEAGVFEDKQTRLTADLTFHELQKRAKELGCKLRIGLRKEELIKMIEDCYVL